MKLSYGREQLLISSCQEHNIDTGSGRNKFQLVIVSSQSDQPLQAE